MDYLNGAELTNESFYAINKAYWSDMPYFIFYILAIAYMLRKRRCEKYVFGYNAIIALLTVFNPIFVLKLVEKLGIINRYYRFYWILPVAIVLSYVFTDIIFSSKKKVEKIIAFVIIMIVIGEYGKGALYDERNKYDNIYKISNETIEVCHIMDECKPEGMDYLKIYNNYGLSLEVQSYDASLQPIIGRYQAYYGQPSDYDINLANTDNDCLLLQIMEDYNIDFPVERVRQAFENYRVTFYIRKKTNHTDEYIKELGYDMIGETEEYEVYFCGYGIDS